MQAFEEYLQRKKILEKELFRARNRLGFSKMFNLFLVSLGMNIFVLGIILVVLAVVGVLMLPITAGDMSSEIPNTGAGIVLFLILGFGSLGLGYLFAYAAGAHDEVLQSRREVIENLKSRLDSYRTEYEQLKNG